MLAVLENRGMIPSTQYKPTWTMGVGESVYRESSTNAPQRIESRIGQLAGRHHLESDELLRLRSIMQSCPQEAWDLCLDEELKDILAARELKLIPPLTDKEIDSLLFASENGLIPVKPRAME